jgi:[protein-PII] uridylyltransferase
MQTPEVNSSEKLTLFRELISNHSNELKKQFHSGVEIADLLLKRAEFIDEILTACWQEFIGTDEEASLIAVGGYGRMEMHPGSDIDILILVLEEARERHQKGFVDFFTFLWDIGLKPGQSVRTLDECLQIAREDITVITNLMETRPLCGNHAFFEQLTSEITPEKMWPTADFFAAKVAEQEARHAKYNDTAYNLEPNIKEGPGGLRDIQTIAWVTQRHLHTRSFKELVNRGYLIESEFEELTQSLHFLWRIRFALHSHTNRCEDRLLFDHQRALAENLGYQDNQAGIAIEQMMQQYYQSIMKLERLNEMLLQLFREALLSHDKDIEITPINERFQARNNYIETTDNHVFSRNPTALLEIFLLLQQNKKLKGIRAATIRLIRENLHLIDNEFRDNEEAQRLFMDILRQPDGITHQFRRMNRYGVLAVYIPDFANIVGRMQYDLFHIYTVDEHTLFLIRNLRRFALKKHYDELPFCNDVFKSIPKPELLFLAGLLHDIAKGKGGDHSLLGEKIAYQFCTKHRLSQYDTLLVTWLVKNHLVMSMTAQRKDISDPDVIHEFATKVGTEEFLNYLYLLTIADIRATNHSLWNSWRDSLLRTLFRETQRALRRGLQNPIDQADEIQNSQTQARSKLLTLGLDDKTISRVWAEINSEYFLRYSVEESIWHTLAIASCPANKLPLVFLRPISKRGGVEIFVYAKNSRDLFALTTATLDQLGLDILDARIMTTTGGFALNSFQVLEQNGDKIGELGREHVISSKLRQRLLEAKSSSLNVTRRSDRQLKHFKTATQVIYHKDSVNGCTVMELISMNRPGLLSIIGQAFGKLNLQVKNAKIATIGERAEDIFYITDAAGEPIESGETKETLKKTLTELLDLPA